MSRQCVLLLNSTFPPDLTDQVAKESSNSTASTHDMHKEDTGATSGGTAKATAEDHKATPVSAISMLCESYSDKM